ncbi:MAG: SH3 domain-containing protein [Gammaproteobacteria bacterium]|nr:SH3 domain-containing protein [Gammaproteobacteria bacterium]MBU1558612.1 SH3 domain-containing protein [Gammaproteobacteria bacterium]MBU2546462.1 SH3 domain-containing protein [Gammaproteobacteria bacterium]
MKQKLFITCAAILFFFFSAASFAKTGLNLYEKPSTSAKVVAQLPCRQSFVPIYRQGHWIKVGLASDGTVGWLDMQQYRACQKARSNLSSQSIVVNAINQPNGKYTVTGYKNGKKMSKKETEQALKSMQRQQMLMQKHFQRMQRQFNHLFGDMQDMMSDFPVVTPMVFVVQPQQQVLQSIQKVKK